MPAQGVPSSRMVTNPTLHVRHIIGLNDTLGARVLVG